MTGHAADTSLNKTARITGLLFLFSLLVPLLNWAFVLSKFIAVENAVDTARNILAGAFLFRIGIINDLITSVVGIALALSLYIMLKSVNKNLALLALYLKLTEAILWAVITLGDYIALLILNGLASLTAFEPEQIQAFVGLFFNAHISVSAVAGIFLGLNLMIFLYLLFKSRYVPGILAGFGILSYALIFAYDLTTILSPNYATTITQAIWGGPSILFEIVIGLWLLIKGVKVQQTRQLH